MWGKKRGVRRVHGICVEDVRGGFPSFPILLANTITLPTPLAPLLIHLIHRDAECEERGRAPGAGGVKVPAPRTEVRAITTHNTHERGPDPSVASSGVQRRWGGRAE
jgi:hypothetical protein